MLLFLWARPTFFLSGPAHEHPRRPQPPRRPRPLTGWSRLLVPCLSLPLPLPDGPHSSAAPPLGTVATAHTSVSPLPLCSAGSTRTTHVACAHQFRGPLCSCLLPPCGVHPSGAPSPPLPIKMEPPPAGRRFFSHPTRHSSRPSTPCHTPKF
jgi:hypothetical protein